MKPLVTNHRQAAAGFSVAYLVLVWLFLSFLAVDACADAGGFFDVETSRCLNYRPEEFRTLDGRPWTFWVFVAFGPAPLVAISALLVRYVLKGKRA